MTTVAPAHAARPTYAAGMSIRVDRHDLAAKLDDFGQGYLLTVSADGGVKAVTVEPTIVDGLLRVAGPGRGSLTNAGERPAATVLFPPREHGGYTLLVDGAARVESDDVIVDPASAVLHRPAAHADGPGPAGESACENDCTHL
ncbi:MAG: pyridoxamine 5'-phosphate oxidase [Nocardioides sp.]|nr:pyridoxamine 5'-phosphate oxidase [Nocardioides sp.]